jgi:hypothetical protein
VIIFSSKDAAKNRCEVRNSGNPTGFVVRERKDQSRREEEKRTMLKSNEKMIDQRISEKYS